MGMTSNTPNQDEDKPLDNGRPSIADQQSNTSDDPSTDPEDATLDDWIEANNSRPTLPDETADGLDDMDEEIRHQAEDLPTDTPGRL
ncbi:hypothetical protein [Lichenihabitans psoromatis]|uniref:hypothetical protein n=1 Tax=Lichenihabitans psoromatis TaxID=2528642 RepID=UPI001038498D|nr:hypothetical protein [Lichenihabitans psoromatis]